MIRTELTDVIICDFCGARQLAENAVFRTVKLATGEGHRCHRFQCEQDAESEARLAEQIDQATEQAR